jgi:hypothetical protein
MKTVGTVTMLIEKSSRPDGEEHHPRELTMRSPAGLGGGSR